MEAALTACGAPPDLVLCSDVVYRAELVAPLVSTLQRIVRAPGRPAGAPALVLLSYKERGVGPAFFRALDIAGLRCSPVPVPEEGPHRDVDAGFCPELGGAEPGGAASVSGMNPDMSSRELNRRAAAYEDGPQRIYEIRLASE